MDLKKSENLIPSEEAANSAENATLSNGNEVGTEQKKDGAAPFSESEGVTEPEKENTKPTKLRVKPKRKRVKQSDAIRYDVSAEKGLTFEQADERYVDGLINKVTDNTSKSYFSIIFGNTFTFFNLLCALVLTAYAIVGTTISNFIFIIPFASNLIIGIIQEIRAKISVEKLSILQSPVTKVVRNGNTLEIPSDEIVLDDVFKLITGNQIPVDAVILSGYLEVNESVLTGESVPVKKSAGDTIMAGSFVTGGSCFAKADKVGGECFVQKLTAKAKKFKKPNSELMGTFNWIVRIVGLLIVPIAIGMGLVNYRYAIANPPSDTGITAFVVLRTGTVVLGMIPAGLILLTTIALSLGVIRLYKRNTLVQDMYSLEMLARVDVLCLDKTGTITDGRMKVKEDILLADHHPYALNDIIGTMENILDDNNMTAIALRAHYVPEKEFSVIKTLPFTSARKFSAVTFSEAGTYALGAPEFILAEMPDALKMRIDRYTMAGNRVLLLAHSGAAITVKEQLPATMRPVALIVLEDNIREEAIKTIKWFKDNDVHVKVISGDNPITVSEIAKRAGVENASNWISLEGLSNKEIASVADKYTVFGRVTPDQKAVLIKTLKNIGHTVAMTGDGVNDILAMREADCSVTVASGADSAKNVAHIVLADNNFNSMPRVVAEGRRVINNIQQSASLFLMKTIFITLLALLSILTGKPFPFETKMLTILELVIIGFASLILSLQPNEKRVEGDFLSTIFSNAIPGALILLLNVYIVKFFDLFDVFESEKYSLTLQVVAFTFGGLVYLFYICKPLNLTRGIVTGISTLVIMLWFTVFLDTTPYLKGLFDKINPGADPNFFGLTSLFPMTKDNWQFIILIICIVQFDILIISKLVEFNKKITGDLKKNKNNAD